MLKQYQSESIQLGQLNKYNIFFWVIIVAIGLIIAGGLGLFFFISGGFGGPQKRLLPNSVIAKPLLDTPEGIAFANRYPDYEAIVFQDFNLPDCCDVNLVHFHDRNSQIPRITLNAHVNVSDDLKTLVVDDKIGLTCLITEGVWTIKGDIIKNLQSGNRDCWELPPPPRPSDSALLAMARNTTIAKEYLASYPDNIEYVITTNIHVPETKAIFTPTRSEPIEYGVSFGGLDWYILHIWIVCSNGDYHYSDDSDFWPFLEPASGCLQSVHDKLIVANETAQAKAFMAKYPNVRLHTGDSIGQSTVVGNNTSIEYRYRGSWENIESESRALKEAHLIALFKDGTDQIEGFTLTCEAYIPSESPIFQGANQTGMNIDVARFLEGEFCPA